MCTKSLLHFISPAHYTKMLHVACLSVHFAVEQNARSVIGSMYLFFSFLGAGARGLGSFGTGQNQLGHFVWLPTTDFAVSECQL
jgi:hypothetical protein